MRIPRILSLLFVLVLLSAGAISAQDEKVLVVGHAEATDSLDPARGYTQTTSIVEQITYDTLVTFPKDNASTIVPRLASEWTISEDGLTYTFTLRDAMFANGNPITADDVVFSINRLKYVQGNPSFLVSTVASVEAVDEKTVTFTLSQPTPAFLVELANGALSVTDAETVRANGGTDAEDAATTDTAQEYLDNHSAGSGPYILDHWTKQTETVLVRNPNYWGEAPYFDRIIITDIPEAATQKTALESGDVDIALDLTLDQTNTMTGDADITTVSSPGNIVHFLLMNDDPAIGGPMAKPEVQEAVRYALDYAGYVTLWGGVTPASPMAVGFATAEGTEMAHPQDLQKAQDLLTQAGYPDGFDITLDYPILTYQGINMDTNAQKIQADLAAVGINVTLNPAELQVAFQSYRDGQEAFGYWFWGPDIIDPYDTLSFLPGGIVATRANWTEENADPAIIDLRDRARVELDPDTRVDLSRQIQDYLRENGPFAPFIQPNVQTAFSSNLQGYVHHPQWIIDLSILSRAE